MEELNNSIENTENNIKKDNLKIEELQNTVFSAIEESSDFEAKLNNEYMPGCFGRMEVSFGTNDPASHDFKFTIEGDASDFADNLKQEIENQISAQGIKDGQDLKFLNIQFMQYPAEERGKPEAERNGNGGYKKII